MKTCIKCRQTKVLVEFPRHKASAEGYRAICLKCHRDYLRLRLYGMTEAQWNTLFDAQGKRCALCKTDVRPKRGWNTDHDHLTGKVRGILCGKCNVGIGAIGDSLPAALAVVQYLDPTREAVEEHW